MRAVIYPVPAGDWVLILSSLLTSCYRGLPISDINRWGNRHQSSADVNRAVGSVLNHANAGREKEGVWVPLEATDGATQGNQERRNDIDPPPSLVTRHSLSRPASPRSMNRREMGSCELRSTNFGTPWRAVGYMRERDGDKIDIASVSRSQCRFCTNFARDREPARH